MKNDSGSQNIIGQDNSVELSEHNSESRRNALGVLSKFTLGAWSLPMITAVTTPAHATMSVGMEDDDTTGVEDMPEETPPVLAVSDFEFIQLQYSCVNGENPNSIRFAFRYAYESELGVVSHTFSVGSCEADTVQLLGTSNDGLVDTPILTSDSLGGSFQLLEGGTEFGGIMEAFENVLESGGDGLLACSLILTITDAGGNTVSETFSIDNCIPDEENFE